MTNLPKTYFFCGIGGSGMMPLAVLLGKKGMRVIGSDRSYDQGSSPDKFQSLKDQDIELFPQDGHGITQDVDVLVVSSAIEQSIPDVRAAMDAGLPIIKRGESLAELFNSAFEKIAVAGTSGKSTVTGMISTILVALGEDPTLVNGGEILNLRAGQGDKFSGVRKGRDDLFVAEMDESDGSIAHYEPSIAVLNNIALDHKSMEELEQLFGDYLACASKALVVNYDHPRVLKLCKDRANANIISYGIDNGQAILNASNNVPQPHGMEFTLAYEGKSYNTRLNVPGRHNVENALAALGACVAMGLDIGAAVKALAGFKGIHRRMELVGISDSGITVIDDFAHNPDKISASLRTLKEFDGRLIVMFQPHGFGPLRLLGNQIVEAFAKYLDKDDVLLMPEVYYAGGTADRSVTAKHIITDLVSAGVNAHWFAKREQAGELIRSNALPGTRIVIMGARDDSLHEFARELLNSY